MATTDRIHPTRRLLLGACLAVVLVLTACSGGSTRTPPSGRPIDTAVPVKLTWWTGQEAEAQKALEGLAKSFTAQHPNVTIEVSSGASTTEELLQKLSATFLAGTYPDISYAYGNWATELADSERMLDLTAVAAEPASAWQDFPASSRQTATVRSKVIGFPAVVGNLGVIYNPTLFAAAGVPEPTADWTWEDFRVAAKQLTDPAKNIYGIRVRGHHLALLAAALAERQHPVRGREDVRLQLAGRGERSRAAAPDGGRGQERLPGPDR